MLFRNQHTIQSADGWASSKEVPAASGPGRTGGRLTQRSEKGSGGEVGADKIFSIDRATATALAIITIFVLLITIPFLWQPFHVDDLTFLDSASNQLEHPFQLHIDDYQLIGENLGEWRDTHPPGLSLYLAAVMTLTGSESEPVTHASYMIFPLMAAVSMYFLARRFTHNALLATLLLLATPALMTNSHTLMGDLPTMALWLAATVLYIYGIDRDDHLLLGLSSLTVTLAILVGYQALALIGLLPLYALLNRKFTWRALAPMVLPVLAFGAYSAYNLWRYNDLPRFSHRGGLQLTNDYLWSRLRGALLRLGGATVFPLALAAAFSLRKVALLMLPLAAAISISLAIHYDGPDGLSSSGAVLYAVFMAATIVALGAVLVDLVKQTSMIARGREAETDTLYLGLWLTVVLAVIIVLLPHATVKYYLPVLAPLVLLLMRELERNIDSAVVIKRFAVAALVLTLGVGFVISTVDYRYARSYRDFAREVPRRYQGSGTVWFIGEWGLRYYLEQEGYRYLTADSTEPVEGDILLEPSLMHWPISPEVAGRLELIDTLHDEWGFPVRLMNRWAGAGYYGSYWGVLPYALTDEPVESFRIYRVGP